MDSFQRDGKGTYIGESSRSLYERSTEHQRDREDRDTDSHQIKHWQLDHPELSSPPKFKFKMVASFQEGRSNCAHAFAVILTGIPGSSLYECYSPAVIHSIDTRLSHTAHWLKIISKFFQVLCRLVRVSRLSNHAHRAGRAPKCSFYFRFFSVHESIWSYWARHPNKLRDVS